MSIMKNAGRSAGLLYAIASIFGVFGLLYVPSKLIVNGDAAATVRNIAASEMLFRLGIAANLIGQVLFIFVALALYELLKPVNQRRALIMLTLILVAIPIALLNELTAVEQRLRERAADAPGRRAGPEQVARAHGLRADAAGEIQLRVQIRGRDPGLCARLMQLRLRRLDIGSLAHEFRRQTDRKLRRQREVLELEVRHVGRIRRPS